MNGDRHIIALCKLPHVIWYVATHQDGLLTNGKRYVHDIFLFTFRALVFTRHIAKTHNGVKVPAEYRLVEVECCFTLVLKVQVCADLCHGINFKMKECLFSNKNTVTQPVKRGAFVT